MSYEIIIGKNKTQLANASVQDGCSFQDLILPAKDYVFSQVSAVSSVLVDSPHYISKDTEIFINDNGDAFTTEGLKNNYSSFIGAWNYFNHQQEPEKGIGFIGDAVLRRRYLNNSKTRFIYYVDCLVATHRDYSEIVKNIISGKIKFLSMGSNAQYTICTRCGNVSTSDFEDCDHIREYKRSIFTDELGEKRIVAEIIGGTEVDSFSFDELSWLSEPPAFGGASIRNLLTVPIDSSVKLNHLTDCQLTKPAFKKFIT